MAGNHSRSRKRAPLPRPAAQLRQPIAIVGEPILYVSQQLGHSSSPFTLSTYAHLMQQRRRLDKKDTLQKLFEAAKGERAPKVPQRARC